MGGISVPVALLAGVVSFASPCFLPVVPVFVGYMTPQAALVGAGGASATPGGAAQRFATVRHAAVFVGAFGLVFTALWGLVGLVGWAVADYRDILRVAGGIVLILLGLHTAGLIRIPFLDRTTRIAYTPAMAAAPTYRRSFMLGLAFGAGWTPCIGPVLGGILGLATRSESVGGGVALLLVYTLGLGIPFILVCAGLTGLAGGLSWFSRHQRAVSIISGVILMVIGFLMIADLFSGLSALTSPHW